jgi:hypothetical protein
MCFVDVNPMVVAGTDNQIRIVADNVLHIANHWLDAEYAAIDVFAFGACRYADTQFAPLHMTRFSRHAILSSCETLHKRQLRTGARFRFHVITRDGIC